VALALPLTGTLAAGLVACAPGVPTSPTGASSPPSEREVQRFVAGRVGDSRAFLAQGRLDAAERSARRAVERGPDHPEAHRALAEVLEAQGREAEARRHGERAAALASSSPPLPEDPLAGDSRGLVVLLVDPLPEDGGGPGPAAPGGIRRPPAETAERVIRRHLARRLPEARVIRAHPESVAAARARLEELGARAGLAVGVERGFCDWSQKDGHFGLAWLRVAGATRAGVQALPTTVRWTLDHPPRGEACIEEALVRALEKALARPGMRRLLREVPAGGRWPSPALRALFPGLGRRVALHVEEGRRALSTGRVNEAAAAFRAALAVDPQDTDARAYLREAEETLALVRALPETGENRGAPGVLPFSLRSREREIAEGLLGEERRRREALRAALRVAEGDSGPPSPAALAALRRIRLPDPPTPGVELARKRVGGPVEARALYDSRGARLAVYYFPRGGQEPVLREEDRDGDGRADTWNGYHQGQRSDRWETRRGGGWPDLHLEIEPDGEASRIALDENADRRPERVFTYADGQLAAEARDVDGDGVLDRFDSLDSRGRVVVREEDLDGDGRIDVRSRFRDGRLLSREIENPGVAEAYPPPSP